MPPRLFAAIVLSSLLLLSVFAAAPDLEGPFPASDSEVCVVCYGAVGAQGIAYLIDGQRYAVHQSERAQFLSDPAGYVEAWQRHRLFTRLAWLTALAVLSGAGLLLWRRRRPSA